VGTPSRGIHGIREAALSMSTALVQVPFEIVQKWQEIVNIIAEIVHVPSALVMKVEPPNIKVFLSSESNGNPYERDELAPLNTGLYCETVMKTRQSLLVPDALRDEAWKSNPDIKLGMISYLGFPVTWPDGQIFGTICVLDKKENSYSELYRKFVLQCRDVLQADLRSLARLSGELTRSEAYLEEAQRLSHTGSFGWRISTGEIVWSKESFRIFGFDQSLAVTLDMVLERVHPEDRDLVQTTLGRASRDRKDFDYEYRLLMPDGSIKHVNVAAHSVGDQADQLEFIGAVMDVTEARRVEEQMHQARADLAHVARVTTLGELTAAIAHEINQPLSALVTQGSACLRWLAQEPPNLGEGRSSVEAMINSGIRAAEVVTRLRAMMKKSPLHKDLLNINDAILAVIALVGAEAQRNRVLLRTELSNDLPLVLGDRIQLQQVILNLIMNAIEAMKGIDQTQRKVLVVSRKDEPNGALVEVQDSGAGLEGLALDRLFDAFYTTKPDGMGIGLAVSRRIIESHGGQLRALPNVPKGAVFRFQLPSNVDHSP
jgi:PAS domain S-box-containing protein